MFLKDINHKCLLLLFITVILLSNRTTFNFSTLCSHSNTVSAQIWKYYVKTLNLTLTIHENNSLTITETYNIFFEDSNIKYFSRKIYFEGFHDIKFLNISSDIENAKFNINYYINYVNVQVEFRNIQPHSYGTITIKYKVNNVLEVVNESWNRLVWLVVKSSFNTVIENLYVYTHIPKIYSDPTILKCNPKPLNIKSYNNETVIIFWDSFIFKRDFYITIIFPKITNTSKETFFFEDHPYESAMLISLITFAMLFCLYYFWGRPPIPKFSSLTYSINSPLDMRPVEAGYLMCGSIHENHILSMLLELAVRNGIKIIYNGESISFEEAFKGSLTSTSNIYMAKEYDRKFIDIVKKCKNAAQLFVHNWREVKKIGKLIEKELVAKGYFRFPPSKLKKIFFYTGLALALPSLLIIIGSNIMEKETLKIVRMFYGLFLGMILSGIILIFTSLIFFKVYGERGVLASKNLENYLNSILNGTRIQPDFKKEFEQELLYIVALTPEKFEDWAKNWIGKISYIPSWLKVKVEGLTIDDSVQGFERFINIIRFIISYVENIKWNLAVSTLFSIYER